jgi:hypothetical protein
MQEVSHYPQFKLQFSHNQFELTKTGLLVEFSTSNQL